MVVLVLKSNVVSGQSKFTLVTLFLLMDAGSVSPRTSKNSTKNSSFWLKYVVFWVGVLGVLGVLGTFYFLYILRKNKYSENFCKV